MKNEEKDLKISDMLLMSMELWEKNKDSWAPMEAKYGKNFILYMIEEIGETIAIIKKKGEESIMEDNKVREHFVEELGDTLMYFMDVLNRFNISPEEFSKVYTEKFQYNMNRDYDAQYKQIK